jgi:competence protein ComEA
VSRLPAFSRAQLGILILLGAVLFLLYAWRGNLGWTPSKPAPSLAKPVFVEIAGEVPRPGVYSFPAPPTLLELSQKAGGPNPGTNSNITVPSGSRVEVSPTGEYRPGGRMSGERLLSLGLALDVNKASVKDLEALPGIGPVMAQRLVQYRQDHGPFKNLDELLAVSGVGKQKLAQLKPYLTLSPGPSGP